jgi:hypothetical protein
MSGSRTGIRIATASERTGFAMTVRGGLALKSATLHFQSPMIKSACADCRADFSPDEGEKSKEYSVYCKIFYKSDGKYAGKTCNGLISGYFRGGSG